MRSELGAEEAAGTTLTGARGGHVTQKLRQEGLEAGASLTEGTEGDGWARPAGAGVAAAPGHQVALVSSRDNIITMIRHWQGVSRGWTQTT